MKKLIMYQTLDKSLHNSLVRGKQHAENVYGSRLTSMAHRLVSIDKYVDMVTFLEQNLDAFAEISQWKEDIKLEVGNEIE